jgi:hypothetical protein
VFEPGFDELKRTWMRSDKLSDLLLGEVFAISTPDRWHM